MFEIKRSIIMLNKVFEIYLHYVNVYLWNSR